MCESDSATVGERFDRAGASAPSAHLLTNRGARGKHLRDGRASCALRPGPAGERRLWRRRIRIRIVSDGVVSGVSGLDLPRATSVAVVVRWAGSSLGARGVFG